MSENPLHGAEYRGIDMPVGRMRMQINIGTLKNYVVRSELRGFVQREVLFVRIVKSDSPERGWEVMVDV